MSDKCLLVQRGIMYDVYINGKKCGSGNWGYVDTAHYFYLLEGMDVKIVDE